MPQRFLIADDTSEPAKRPPSDGASSSPAREIVEVPAGLEGVLRLAQLAVDTGAYEDAAGWFELARKIEPGSAWLAFSHGVCLEPLGRLDEAREALTQALELRPELVPAGFRLAALEAQMGRSQQALARLEALLPANPELVDIARDHPSLESLRDHPRFCYLVS